VNRKHSGIIQVLCYALIFFGCHYSGGNESMLSKEDSVLITTHQPGTLQKPKDFNLSSFTFIPDTIDGCGDYYLLDTSTISSKRYVFLSRMSEVAVILLDGDTIYLNIDSTVSKTTDKVINDVYRGKNNLKVILNVKKYKEFDEGAFYKGELIISIGSRKEVFKIHGQTGC
jgi:hypothetical protein